MKRVFLLAGLLMLTNVQAGELYRWVDRDGKVHYGDMPQPGTEDLEELKLGKEPAPDESLPYETQRAMRDFPVTLYAFPDCGPACQKARDFLNKRGIPYTEKSLVKQEDLDAFRKDSGNSQLPAATVGKTWLRGFQAGTWNSELDFAGYPKSVLKYRPPRPATPPAQPAQ